MVRVVDGRAALLAPRAQPRPRVVRIPAEVPEQAVADLRAAVGLVGLVGPAEPAETGEPVIPEARIARAPMQELPEPVPPMLVTPGGIVMSASSLHS